MTQQKNDPAARQGAPDPAQHAGHERRGDDTPASPRTTPADQQPKSPGSAAPAGEEALPMPHERDESPRQAEAEAAPRGVIEQAKRDLDAGQVDTDLRNGGGLDSGQRDELLRKER